MRHGFQPRLGTPAPAYYFGTNKVCHGFHWGDRRRLHRKLRHKHRRWLNLARQMAKARRELDYEAYADLGNLLKETGCSIR